MKGKAVPIGQKEHRGGTGIFHQPRCRKTGCKRRACAPDPGGGLPAPAAPASNCCHTVCRSGPRSSPPVCGIRYPGGAVCLRWRWNAERAGSGRGRQRECSGRLCALRQRERLCAQLRRGGPSAFFRFCRPAAGTALPGGPAANIPWYRNRYLRRRAGRSGGIWHPKIPAAAGMRGNSSLYALDSTGYAQPLRPQAARCDRRQRVYRYLYDGGHL